MRLVLKNFRCYENKEFTFEDGLTLISGESGTGKTTIFLAVLFVLYNKGNKITTFGKKSCSVTLETDDLIVVRTKSPNKLIVNGKYEDDVAQSIINNKFGNNMFESISYLPQFPTNSFVLLTPTQKLEFIEKFAFKDVDLKGIKNNVKEQLKQIESNLLEYKSKIEVTEQILSEINLTEIFMDEYIKSLSCGELEKQIENEIDVKHKLESETRLLSESVYEINERIKCISVYETKRESLELRLKENNKEKSEIEQVQNKLNYRGDSYLESLEKKVKILDDNKIFFDMQQKLKENKKTLQSIREEEISNYIKEKKEIEELLIDKEETLDIEEQIDNIQNIISIKSNISKLENELFEVEEKDIDNMEKELLLYKNQVEDKVEIYNKKKLQLNIFTCPSCETNLRLVNNNLHRCEIDLDEIDVNTDALNNEILLLKTKINNIEYSIISSKEKITSNKQTEKNIKHYLEKLMEYEIEEGLDILELENEVENCKSILEENEKNLKRQNELQFNLDNNIFSKSYDMVKTQVSILESNIKNCKIKNIIEDENSLRDEYYNQKNLQNTNVMYNSQLEKIKNTNKVIQEELVLLNSNYKYDNKISIDELEMENKRRLSKIKENKEYIRLTTNNIEKIKSYLQYKIEFEKYNKWKTVLNDLTEKEKHENIKHVAALSLKDKILKAESIVTIEIIKNLAKHTQYYLDLFFKDNPMTIDICPFKIVKKIKKPQIEIIFYYKGMECQINMLSGGEMARVILAFTLALGDIFNISLLMLDECTANLSEDLTNDVFSCIKNNSNAKYVLAIAHQVVQGDFDNILKM